MSFIAKPASVNGCRDIAAGRLEMTSANQQRLERIQQLCAHLVALTQFKGLTSLVYGCPDVDTSIVDMGSLASGQDDDWEAVVVLVAFVLEDKDFQILAGEE